MNIKISREDITWNYMGYFLRIASNVILLPLILNKMSPDEVGVWYVFLSMGALIQLLDLGFNPTIMRNISYAFGGATQLQKHNIDQQQVIQGKPNYCLVYKLINVSRKIYLNISIIAAFLILTVGTYYVNHLTAHLNNANILIAWGLFSVGIFFNFYYSYWMPVLSGIGKIKEMEQANIISQVVYLLIGSIGIIESFGLLALSLAFMISGIVLRGASKYYFNKSMPEKIQVTIEENEYKELFYIIWHTAKQIGLVFLGAFLILQANTLICATFFDLRTTAQYGLTLQLFSVVSVFASIMFRSYLPVISEARIKNSQFILKKYLALTAMVGWIFFVVGAIFIVFFGEPILRMIGSETTLLPKTMLVLMAIILFLEFNHGAIFSTFIITNNEVPFVKAALMSGLLIVSGSIILIHLFQIGVWSILISQGIVQLAYNNWKWPSLVLKQLNLSLRQLICMGLHEIKFALAKK